MDELNSLLCDVHNETLDLTNYLANKRPPKEEEEDKNDPPGLEKIEFQVQAQNPVQPAQKRTPQKTRGSRNFLSHSFAASPTQPTQGITRLTKRQKQFFGN